MNMCYKIQHGLILKEVMGSCFVQKTIGSFLPKVVHIGFSKKHVSPESHLIVVITVLFQNFCYAMHLHFIQIYWQAQHGSFLINKLIDIGWFAYRQFLYVLLCCAKALLAIVERLCTVQKVLPI